jgi:hypothetical protein
VVPGDEGDAGPAADLAREVALLTGREPGDDHEAEPGGQRLTVCTERLLCPPACAEP